MQPGLPYQQQRNEEERASGRSEDASETDGDASAEEHQPLAGGRHPPVPLWNGRVRRQQPLQPRLPPNDMVALAAACARVTSTSGTLGSAAALLGAHIAATSCTLGSAAALLGAHVVARALRLRLRLPICGLRLELNQHLRTTNPVPIGAALFCSRLFRPLLPALLPSPPMLRHRRHHITQRRQQRRPRNQERQQLPRRVANHHATHGGANRRARAHRPRRAPRDETGYARQYCQLGHRHWAHAHEERCDANARVHAAGNHRRHDDDATDTNGWRQWMRVTCQSARQALQWAVRPAAVCYLCVCVCALTPDERRSHHACQAHDHDAARAEFRCGRLQSHDESGVPKLRRSVHRSAALRETALLPSGSSAKTSRCVWTADALSTPRMRSGPKRR